MPAEYLQYGSNKTNSITLKLYGNQIQSIPAVQAPTASSGKYPQICTFLMLYTWFNMVESEGKFDKRMNEKDMMDARLNLNNEHDAGQYWDVHKMESMVLIGKETEARTRRYYINYHLFIL